MQTQMKVSATPLIPDETDGDTRSQGRPEGNIILPCDLHSDHAIDFCPVYELHTTIEKNPSGS